MPEPTHGCTQRDHGDRTQHHQSELAAAVYRGPGLGSFLAAAAAVVMVGFVAASALNWSAPTRELALSPVIATKPELPPSPIVNQGFVASASAGMPIWPAAVLAEQVPVHFATEEFQLAGWGQ